MSGKTTISWAQRQWNPTLGCKLVTAACTNCYAMWRAAEIARGNGAAAATYRGLIAHVNGKPVWNGETAIQPDPTLEAPLRWRDPAIVFVDSMADLFYERVPETEILRALEVMRRAERHLFLILTKRPARMRDVIGRWKAAHAIDGKLRNIGVGASVHDQANLESFAPHVAAIESEVRFLSCEPLLAPLDLSTVPAVDWVIVGGESVSPVQRARGERARPFDPDWARAIRDHCRKAGVLFHFKQLGCDPVGLRPAHPRGEDISDIPEDLRIREAPTLRPAQANLL